MNEQDFPNLEMIYLDSACMSLRPEPVIDAITEYYTEYPGCPGRSAHAIGEQATDALEDARESVAGFIDAAPEGLVFTSGTTEAINTVAHGFDTGHVILSDREHNSNLVPWQQTDAEQTIIPTDGGFAIERFKEAVGEGDLVSMVHVSNLDGHTLPVEEIIDIAHDAGAYTLIDAAQSVPHQPVSVDMLDPDFMAFSGHKMLGPSGTGALYVSDRVRDDLAPHCTGGGAVTDTSFDAASFRSFPDRMEAGLPDLAGFIGFGAAAQYLDEIGMGTIQDHEQALTKELRSGLQRIDGLELVGEPGTGIVSFRIDGVDPGQTALMLDQRNIAVRSGMHCVHAWFDRYDEEPTVRASLHLYNTEEDIEKFIAAVQEIALLS